MTPPTARHSLLADVERAFRRASESPAVLALDGSDIGPDLPQRSLPLTELRGLLMHGTLCYQTKDRALGVVAQRAQQRGELWTIGFGGLLMPGLKRVARRLRQVPCVDAEEVGSEVVAGLVATIPTVDPLGERIAASVCWAVYRRSARALGVRPPSTHEAAWPPGTVAGAAVAATNPEEAIARAVRAGVITQDDAELIALTRIEGTRISDLAVALSLPAHRLQKRRVRAEARIAELLRREGTRTIARRHAAQASVSSPAVAPGRCPWGYRAQPQRRLPGTTVTELAFVRPAAGEPPQSDLRLRSAAA